MVVVDYIIIAVTVVAIVIGIIRGFLRPLFDIAGIFVVTYAGGAFSSLLKPLLSNLFPDESTCSIVSAIASVFLVWFAYFLISRLLMKIINKTKLLGALNRILGGVLGVVIIFLVLSIVTAFVNNEHQMFTALRESDIGKAFSDSWIVQNIFGENAIGNGIVRTAFQKLGDMFGGTVQ